MYDGVDDLTLAKAYKQKHYADLDESVFLEKVGLLTKEVTAFDTATISEDGTAVFATPDAITASDDNTQTRAYKPSQVTQGDVDEFGLPKLISPQQQDEEIQVQDYVNPESDDWELGKRFVNRVNKLTSDGVEALYKGLDIVTTNPLIPLGLATEGMIKADQEKSKIFENNAKILNDFIYEKNKLKIKGAEKPTHDWSELKKAFSTGGVFDIDAWQELGNYIVGSGVESVPDMGAMVANLPLYFASRLQDAAEKRAKNQGRSTPSNEDYTLSAAPTMGSILLDRWGLLSNTKGVVENIGKSALEGTPKDIATTIAKEIKNGTLREGTTEAAQTGLEKFGEEVGTIKGLSSAEEYADEMLGATIAGGGMGGVMSGTTATGTQVFNEYNAQKKQAIAEHYIQEAYNKQMLTQGIKEEITHDGLAEFGKQLETKIKTIQDEFTNLTINHPDHNIPIEAIDNIELQEQVVAQAKEAGLNTTDNQELNAIDKGFKELENELFGPAEQDTIEPKGADARGLGITQEPKQSESTWQELPEDMDVKVANSARQNELTVVDLNKKMDGYAYETKDIQGDGGVYSSIVRRVATEEDIARQKKDALMPKEFQSYFDDGQIDEAGYLKTKSMSKEMFKEFATYLQKNNLGKYEKKKGFKIDSPALVEMYSALTETKDAIKPKGAQDEGVVKENLTTYDSNPVYPDENKQNPESKLAQLQDHHRYKDLLEMRKDVSSTDARSPNKTIAPRDIRQTNEGQGWETDVTPALYERNYDYDFSLTKSDIKKLLDGKPTDEIIRKLESDLSTLDEHSDYQDTRFNKYSTFEYNKAYDFLSTETRSVKGAQSSLEFEGVQNPLFDIVSSNEYVVPAWAKPLVSNVTKYEDIIAAITNAKNGKPNELATRAMQQLWSIEAPHMQEEIARYEELAQKWEYSELEGQEIEALTELLWENYISKDGESNGRRDTKQDQEPREDNGAREDLSASQGTVQPSNQTGIHQGTSQGTSNRSISAGQAHEIKFDINKEYLTKGIKEEIPSRKISKQIQKDVARYAQQLQKALGDWEVATDKKGKALPFMGVSDNISPVGGDASFRLYKPNSDYGVYISLRYEPDMDDTAYALKDDGLLNGHLYRVTNKKKSNDGNNQWAKSQDLTKGSFVNAILKIVEQEEKNNERTTERSTQRDTKQSISSVSDGISQREHQGIQPRDVEGAVSGGSQQSTTSTKNETSRSGTSDNGVNDQQRVSTPRSQGSSDTRRDTEVQLDDNFEIIDEIGDGGLKSKFKDNIKAIEIVKNIQDKGHRPTTEDKKILARYVGWGGLPNAFLKPDGTVAKGWEKESAQLKEILSDEQYAEARRSTQDAHYTSKEVVNAIWSGVKQLGFKGGKVLEPSVGVGNFFGMMPSSLKSSTKLYGVELDSTTATIANALYPKANIQNKGFQEVALEDGSYSLVIGNPPFGSQKLFDKNYKHLSDFSIHNYFFAKGIDALEEGGILAMVVSNGLMDAGSAKAREYIGSKANLLGAIRLPNNAFSKNANTEVTTDIIFLQKRYKGQESNTDVWRDISELNDTPINQYFANNQNMMLGEWGKFGSMYRGDAPALIPFADKTAAELLPDALASLPKNIVTHESVIKEDTTSAKFDGDVSKVRVGAMFVQNGKIFQRDIDKDGEPQIREIATRMNSKDQEVELKAKELESIRGMIEVVGIADTLRRLQLDKDSSESSLAKARQELNKSYDSFVQKHGFLNNAANAKLFNEDIRSPFLLALEKNYEKGISATVAKNTGEPVKKESAEKADIFKTRTQSPYIRPTKAEDSQDALTISLSEFGGIRFDYMQDLTGKSEEQLIKDLNGFIYEDINDGWVTKEEYLSGNVKQKYKEAKDEFHKKALQSVIPKDIDAVDISVTLGSGWIPASDMADFVSHITGDDNPSVAYAKYNGKWSVSSSVKSSNATRWGTDKRGADEILQQTMNLVAMEIKNNTGSSANPVWELDSDATTAVQDKQEQMKEEFKDWIWNSSERRERLGALYNENFNNKALREFNGTHIKFVGKSNSIDLRQHQKNGVWRVLQGDTVLFDHTVGTGKTFTAIASVMELRRTGKAKKPLVIVPNHLTAQWGKEWMEIYPSANILVPTKADFAAKRRKVLMSKIATGDYDGIIIAHSQLTSIQNDIQFEAKFLEDEIARIQQSIDDLKAADGKSRSVKDAEKSKDRLKDKLAKLNDMKRDDNLDFSELGIDALVVDEAHEFKNLTYTTGLQKVAGLGNPQGSKKAFDLFIKTQNLLEKTGGNNLVFLTGTPISNTIAEMFTMQRYLSYDKLKEQNLDVFDAWVKQYAEIVSDWELSPSGKYKLNTRLKKFNNMPELITEYKMFGDVVTREDIPSLPIPKIKGGRAQNIVVERSDVQAAYIGVEDANGKYPEGSLVYRSENMPKGKPKKGDDNMLKIMGEARKVALDMRLIDPNYADNPNSKVNLTVKNTIEIYKKWNDKKGTQLIFCDLSTPKGAVAKEKARIEDLVRRAEADIDENDNKAVEDRDKAAEVLAAMNPDDLDALNSDFSVYDDIKAKLISGGIKENEIAFIHDAGTDKQKEELFGKVKSGRVRVLLGSTSKMGAGMNVQNKLVALHHIDVPWRPSDLEQREGRIVRQGNEFFKADPKGFEVEIFRYATKNTLDSMMWQTIEAKANFIEQLRAGNLLDREVDDVSGEALNAAEMKAMSSGNPLILEDMKVRKDIKKLEALKKSHDRSQYDLEAKIKDSKQAIDQSKETLDAFNKDEKKALAMPKKFEMKVDDKVFKSREEAGDKLLELVSKMEEDKSSLIGEIAGFKIYGEKSTAGLIDYNPATIIVSGAQDYEISFNLVEQKGLGLSTKIVNAIAKIPNENQGFQMQLEETKKELLKLESEIKEFKQAGELDTLRIRQKEILAQLRKKDDDKKESSNVDEFTEGEVLDMIDTLEGRSNSSFMKAPTPQEQRQIEADNAYVRANGYDEAGMNYVPTYSTSGMPSRPKDGVITLGQKKIILPTLDKPMNADSVRVYLSDIVGNRLYESKLRNKSALGVYKRKDSAIRLKSYSDVEVMAHEMAHYLDYFYNNKSRNAEGSFFRSEILKNKEEVKALSYTTKPKEVLSEGFAEFVRLWLTNYNALTLVAPNMIKDFEAKLVKDKSLYTKMLLLQEGMHQFYYQGAEARLRGKQGGEINSIAKKIKRSQKELLKDMRQKSIDKIHSVKRIEAEIRGDVAPDAIDSAYKTLQLAEHSSSIMHTAMHFGVPTVLDNGDLSYSGKSLNAIFAPAAKVSEERLKLFSDYLVAKRASELMEQGRENLITRDEIEAGLDLAYVYPEFETMFEEYQEFNNRMLDFYVDMSLITPSQRENFLEMNKNYVPFHRIVESVQDGKVPPAKIGQRLTGGTHSLGNIMENIISSLETNIKQAMVSRGKSVFYKMLEDSGMGGVFATKISPDNKLVKSDIEQQAKKVAQLMADLGITVAKDGMILSGSIESELIIDVTEIEQNLLDNPSALEFWTHGHKPTSQTGYIDTVIIDGKKVYFEVHDAGLIDAITSFGNTNYNAVMQGLMSIKNIMTWNITNNPLFYFTNFARDTVSAGVLSKNKFLPILSSVSGMYHFLTKSKVYKEFMASGGGYGTRRTTLGGNVDAMGMLEVNRGLEVLSKILSGMAYGADVFEYGTRIGDFALSQKAGKSNMQSAFEGNEVSTDFTIKGSNTTITGLMATVPFMKAAINGMDKTARRIFSLNGEMKFSNAAKFRNQLGDLKKEKLKLYYMGGALAGITLALWFQNKDDERYKKLTRDQRLLNWNFFIGDKHIKVPRPYDIGFVFSGAPEIVADGIYAKHGKDAAEDFMWGIKTMFSIGDVPGIFQPILDDMTNTNWTGGAIIPTYLENLDDKGDQYLNSTPVIYRKLGKVTGASPIMMQHYIDGYLGLTAKMIEEMTEKILWNKEEWGDRAFEKDALEFMTYRFRGREVEPRTKYTEKYYELANKAKGIKSSYDLKIKKSFIDQGKNIKEYMTDNKKAAYITVNKMLTQYNSTLIDIKNAAEFIQYDKSKSRSSKEKMINELYTKRNNILEKISTKLEVELDKLEEK